MVSTDNLWRYFKWRTHKVNKRLVRAVCRRLYRDSNQDTSKSLLIAGTGRSGTTWLADIVAAQIPSRIMFEPFYNKYVKEFSRFHYFHYMRPTDQDDELLAYCQKIFSGDIRHKWIDSQVDRIFSEKRLIKAIRANLFLKWFNNNFSDVPILFIIRHPCAVVLSRMQLNWATDTDIEPFLAQPKFVADFLTDKIDLIKDAKTLEEKHAIIWCISNLVPLKQFQSGQLPIFFYENLCFQLEVEIAKIFQVLKLPHQAILRSNMNIPSTTTRPSSAIVQGVDRIHNWQSKLSSNQVRLILSIVKKFGLDYLYNDSAKPLIEF